MQTHLRGRDVIDFQEWTKDEIDTVLDVAFALKRDRALGRPHPYLRDKVLAMLFFFSSTRTRTSFEAGMAQLGGHAQFIESRSTQIAHGDTAKEMGEILGRYNDGIAIRNVDWGFGNAYLREVAEASRVPVLNMQCDHFHPHQALADLMTIIERFGDPRGRTATVSWACAKTYSKPLSVPQSLIMLLPRFGMNVRLVHPPEFALMPDLVDQARQNARHAHASFEILEDFDEGIRDTDVVYAKSWGAVLTTADEAEEARLVGRYESWITDDRRLATAGADAVFMHPLPAERGVEVTDEVIDGPRSAVYDQAENRLHGQKAVMALTMG
jgi:ornithine carbamoyltransferase